MTADSKPIESLDLSVCTYSCLKRHGINTVGDLVKLGDEGLSRVENLSQTRIAEIKEKLSGYASEEMVPVAHAHWEDTAWGPTCSCCGEELEQVIYLKARGCLKDFDVQDSECYDYVDIAKPYPDYCPNCGAKMDEVSE